jgi:hypothetical protein
MISQHGPADPNPGKDDTIPGTIGAGPTSDGRVLVQWRDLDGHFAQCSLAPDNALELAQGILASVIKIRSRG